MYTKENIVAAESDIKTAAMRKMNLPPFAWNAVTKLIPQISARLDAEDVLYSSSSNIELYVHSVRNTVHTATMSVFTVIDGELKLILQIYFDERNAPVAYAKKPSPVPAPMKYIMELGKKRNWISL